MKKLIPKTIYYRQLDNLSGVVKNNPFLKEFIDIISNNEDLTISFPNEHEEWGDIIPYIEVSKLEEETDEEYLERLKLEEFFKNLEIRKEKDLYEKLKLKYDTPNQTE